MRYEEFKQQFNISLNPQQEAAVQAVQGPVLLLAVPGSGKTTVLVSRVGYMLYCCGVMPEEILVMTYTVAATKDMRQRFCSIFGNKFADRLDFRTINGVAFRIIKYYEKRYGRKAFELVAQEARLTQLVSEAYRKVTTEYGDESDIKDTRTQITYIKNMCLADEEIDKLDAKSAYTGAIYREYCRIMRESKLMDYDDQMVYSYQILQKCPDILRHFQQRYQYLCVDEAQDTSKIQHMIIKLLADKHHNLFMVGDEDQSIYGFRAAYPEALIEFKQVYPDASCLLMENNYRSTKQIVDAADKFIQKNQNRHPKHMVTTNDEGSAIEQTWVYDRKAQYEYIVDIGSSCTTETAVLYRDNDSVLPMIDLLERRKIKYRCQQLESTFFNHKIIRDITDIIRLSYDPTDTQCFLRIYYKLNAGINKVQAVTAIRNAEISHEPVFEYLLKLSSISQWTQMQAKALSTHLLNLKKETAERAVYRIVKFMGYGEYLSRNNMDTSKVDILESIAARVGTPDELLHRLEVLNEVVKSGSADPQYPFILSTVHSSKGLEYDRVILVDVIDSIFPKLQVDEALEMPIIPEEERRLFYVAMTRAKKELQLITFRKEDLVSTFAIELFPRKPVQEKILKTQDFPSNAVRQVIKPQITKPLPSEKILWVAKDFIPNTRIRHKMFGVGVIMEKNGTTVSIRFADGTEKQFDLITTLTLNVLCIER
ncbi:ATP-dependent helicase [Oscillospiraceae bacterium PP1C4]